MPDLYLIPISAPRTASFSAQPGRRPGAAALPAALPPALAKYWQQRAGLLACLLAAVLLAGCGSTPGRLPADSAGARGAARPDSGRGQEVALFALGLLDTGYRFGGKNPAAGLDCSGMASYVMAQSAGISLAGSAASIARQGRKISPDELRAGDLVFFNTRGGPYTHVGISLGDGRFVHAPSTASGRVRVDSLNEGYFAQRFTEARAYFD